MKEINRQSNLIPMSNFTSSVLPHNQILCLHHFNLKSFYFQSDLCQTGSNYIRCVTAFFWASSSSSYFTVERNAKTLHLVPCKPSRQNRLDIIDSLPSSTLKESSYLYFETLTASTTDNSVCNLSARKESW